MLADKIKAAVSEEAVQLRPFYNAFNEYTSAYRDALPASERTPARIAHVQQSADTLRQHLPQAKRLCQQAVEKLKAAGVWNEELDSLVDQWLAQQVSNAGLTQAEQTRLAAFLMKGATPRDNIETAIAALDQPPLTMTDSIASAPNSTPGGSEAGTGTSASEAAWDPCFYWWMCSWICCFGTVMILAGFVVCFAGMIIISLVCYGP